VARSSGDGSAAFPNLAGPGRAAAAGQRRKWRALLLLSVVQLLGMSVWFSASAVVPALTALWRLDDTGRAWVTISVQLGFVAGALVSALLNVSDRIAPPRLLAASSALAGLCTLMIPALHAGFAATLVLRFLSGLFLAGVYPVGMKIVASWTREDRGVGIGLLVGAIVLGSATPHLVRAWVPAQHWHEVLQVAAASAFAGALLALALVREGPYRTASAPFDFRYILKIATQRDIVLANVGYLGHMWELYAMWSWTPIFLAAHLQRAGHTPALASWVSFAVIAAGAPASFLAGKFADRWGRTTITLVSLATSGACALVAGLLFAGSSSLLVLLCLLWGFAVVADSAQFSACVTELCDPVYTGTALTFQTSLGFLLTSLTIWLVPALQHRFGWPLAFGALALGPAVGAWAMAALRASPSAAKLAGGRG
jgi:MFS family permease